MAQTDGRIHCMICYCLNSVKQLSDMIYIYL